MIWSFLFRQKINSFIQFATVLLTSVIQVSDSKQWLGGRKVLVGLRESRQAGELWHTRRGLVSWEEVGSARVYLLWDRQKEMEISSNKRKKLNHHWRDQKTSLVTTGSTLALWQGAKASTGPQIQVLDWVDEAQVRLAATAEYPDPTQPAVTWRQAWSMISWVFSIPQSPLFTPSSSLYDPYSCPLSLIPPFYLLLLL